jgi:hypothetical protein
MLWLNYRLLILQIAFTTETVVWVGVWSVQFSWECGIDNVRQQAKSLVLEPNLEVQWKEIVIIPIYKMGNKTD